MTIIRRVTRTTQPQTPVRVDWSNPITRGLIGVYTPIDPGISLANAASVVGNITPAASQGMRAWRGAYQASNNYIRVERGPFTYTSEVTFEALLRVEAFQTTAFPYISGVIGQYQSDAAGSPYYGPVLRFNSTAAIGDAAKPAFIVTQSGTERRASSSVALSAGRVYHLLGTYDGANITLYVDGVQIANTALTGSFDNHASNFISLGSDYVVATGGFSQNRCLNGDIYLARIYNKGKTAAEARALAANAWQLFAPRRLIIPTSVSAGGDITIALTGQSVSSAVGTLTPVASIAVTGQGVTASAGTLSTQISVALGGIAVSTAVGVITPSLTIPLGGALVSVATGTITPSVAGDVTVALAGSAVTASAGSLGVIFTIPLSGASAAISAGTLAVVHTNALTGSSVTIAAGTLTPSGGTPSTTVIIRAGSWIRYQKIQ